MHRVFRLIMICAAACAAYAAREAGASFIIDPFVVSQNVFGTAGGGATSAGVTNAGGLGGNRVLAGTSPLGSRYFSNADANISNINAFTYTTPNSPGPSGTNGTSADLIYDGSTNATPSTIHTTGLGGFNALTSSGPNTGILLTGSTSSSFGMDILLTAYNGSTIQTASLHVPTGSTPTTFYVPFNSFTGGGTDFSNLGALDMHFGFTNNVGGSGEISALNFGPKPLPEPSTFVLCAAAGLLCAAHRLRRRAKS